MKIEKAITCKMSLIAFLMIPVILIAINGAAQEQQPPGKKTRADTAQNAVQPPPKVPVSVEMRMIEMSKLAADELFKEQGGIAQTSVISEKALNKISDLIAKNKAKIVAQSKIITASGASCENKSGRQIACPTEYRASGNSITNSTKARPDGKNVAAGSADISSDILIPTQFEFRDIGTILQVTPVVSPDNQIIDVAFVFERVRVSAYPNKITINLPAGKMEVEQPVFLSDKVTTSFSTQSGATMLVSVCDAVADQDKQEQTGENTILVIMTANVIKANASKAP